MNKWDSAEQKFIMCIQEGRSLAIGDRFTESSDPFVRSLWAGAYRLLHLCKPDLILHALQVKIKTDNKKYSFQTKKKTHTLCPVWKQLFFMCVVDLGLFFSVLSK